MKVILLKSVQKVGKTGDVVDVSDGYAANSLFPNRLAIAATAKNLEALQKKTASVAASKALQHELLEKAISSLPDQVLTIAVRANEKGSLFSKIDESDIVSALLTHRVSISPKNVVLPHPIKELGTYIVTIKEGEHKKEISVSIIASK